MPELIKHADKIHKMLKGFFDVKTEKGLDRINTMKEWASAGSLMVRQSKDKKQEGISMDEILQHKHFLDMKEELGKIKELRGENISLKHFCSGC